MDLQPYLQSIYDLPLSDAIRQSEDAFPWIESFHVLAITLVVGMISIVDLRLLGVRAHTPSLATLERQLLPYVWGAFIVAAISGTLLFLSNATGYGRNFAFQVKIAGILIAGLNMLFLHFIGQRRLAEWDEGASPPAIAKISGALSLMIWIAIIFLGRRVGFTLTPF